MSKINIKNVLIIFTILVAVSFVFVLSGIKKVEADSFSDSGGVFSCTKTGSSQSCSVSRGIGYGYVNGQPLPFQLYNASISASAQGFGNFGPAGGKVKFNGCINSNASMWSGRCNPFFDYDIGNNGISPITGDLTEGDFGLGYQWFVGEIYVNDATVSGSFSIDGRLVEIKSFDVPQSKQQNESFDVSWNLDYPMSGSLNVSGAGISCGAGSFDQGNNMTSCTTSSSGTATLTLTVKGPTGNEPKNVSWTKTINIIAPQPTCQDPSATNNGGPLPCTYPPNQVNLDFTVINQNLQPIGGALVTIDQNFGNGTTRPTDGNGLANFGVDKNKSIGYTVSASNCSSGSGTQNSGSTGAKVKVTLNCSGGGGGGGEICQDPSATNNGGPLPCVYPSPQPGSFNLIVQKNGTGSGTVTAPGISCGSTCSASYPAGTSGSLTATPASGSTFASWSGCNSVSGNVCNLTLNSNKTVTATFNSSSNCVGNQGNSCTSSANSCGQKNTGAIQCDGSCSASTPSNDYCKPGSIFGSLTPASYSCIIPINQSSCIINFSWNTIFN